MEVVKKLKAHVIFKKRSGRYSVKTLAGKAVNGDEKTKILLAEGLVKIDAPKVESVEVEEKAEEAAVETEA